MKLRLSMLFMTVQVSLDMYNVYKKEAMWEGISN